MRSIGDSEIVVWRQLGPVATSCWPKLDFVSTIGCISILFDQYFTVITGAGFGVPLLVFVFSIQLTNLKLISMILRLILRGDQ